MCLVNCCLKDITLFSNCFFTRIYVYVVNEISTDSNADCKDY